MGSDRPCNGNRIENPALAPRREETDKLKRNGGNYSKTANWQPYVLTDGNLITGQNPASSEGAAIAISSRQSI